MNNIFYPKQIIKKKITTLENQCFFAMPFSAEYTNLYDTLAFHLENNGYKCIRVDNNLSASVPIINLILNGIATSQFIIVDISETNANVFYELGITHTVKDYENVFIIKENESKTPFYIQHLQYIPYDKNNLKQLATKLLERLKANQYKNTFKQELSIKQLLKYDEMDDFVNLFSSYFSKEEICIYSELLNGNVTVENVSSIVSAVWKYDKFLREKASKPEIEEHISSLFKLFFEILLSCYQNDEIVLFIDNFLHYSEYGSLSYKKLLSYQTDLAIKFAEKLKLLEITAKWIVEYFQRSKSTHVDLNRYKLEAFLLKNESDQINEYIINALFSDNNYVREHMADIAGEKKLAAAEDNLIIQLKRETNIYTISSIVEALGKIDSKKSIDTMKVWLNNNAERAIKNGDYFAIKHFRNAIVKIDSGKTLKDFDSKYFDVLKINNEI